MQRAGRAPCLSDLALLSFSCIELSLVHWNKNSVDQVFAGGQHDRPTLLHVKASIYRLIAGCCVLVSSKDCCTQKSMGENVVVCKVSKDCRKIDSHE